MTVGQGTVFGGVRGQLVQYHRHRLRSLCCKSDLRALNQRTSLLCAESQLSADELTQAYAMPPAAAQKSVRIRQRIDPAIEYLEELVRRLTKFSRMLGDGCNACEYILHAMVELGD